MACLLLNDVDLYPGPEKEVRPNCYKSIYRYALCRTVISVAYLDSTYWISIHKKWKYLCHSNTGFKEYKYNKALLSFKTDYLDSYILDSLSSATFLYLHVYR